MIHASTVAACRAALLTACRVIGATPVGPPPFVTITFISLDDAAACMVDAQRERDRLWCEALTATLDVETVARLLKSFNERHPDRAERDDRMQKCRRCGVPSKVLLRRGEVVGAGEPGKCPDCDYEDYLNSPGGV